MYDQTLVQETPEELEIRRRKSMVKRMRNLSIVLIVSVTARFLIKDPVPPPPPDRSQKKIRYVPGMLEDISADRLSKMDPRLVAQMRAAEARYKEEQTYKSTPFLGGKYLPAEIPLTNEADAEELRQMQYTFAKNKVNRIIEESVRQSRDLTKGMLIHFRGGGFIKAENAIPDRDGMRINFDRSLNVTLPKRFVLSTIPGSAKWKEPIRPGMVQLKPAPGITITVAKETAKRISVQKSIYDET